MTDLAEIISALVLLEQQLPWVQRLKGAAGDAAPRPIKETQPATPSLAYPPTIGRAPVPELVQKATQVAAKSSAAVQHDQIRARPTPPPRPRALALSNALEEAIEDNPRR